MVLQERNRVLELAPQSATVTQMTRYRSRSRLSFSSGDLRRENYIQPFDHLAPNIDPLGPYTPEADRALKEASVILEQSAALRNNVQTSMESMDKARKVVHASVNNGLINKIAETESLRVRTCFV